MVDFSSYLTWGVVLLGVVASLGGMHWLVIVKQRKLGGEALFARQLAMLAASLLGVIVVVANLPVNLAIRGQMIGFIGLIVSGLLAFASTSIFANLMAGLMLRITQPFRTGDFVRAQGYFGRVVSRGLLDTEIQGENRELISLPNSFFVTNPVSVVHETGTIVSAEVSLGYENHHDVVEQALLHAAEECGLTDAFVHILELQDFCIRFRVSGFLKDVKSLLTSRSNLYRHVLDRLHQADIEILTPAFMVQRRSNERVLPNLKGSRTEDHLAVAERVAFDQADKAHQRELEKQALGQRLAVLEERLKSVADEEKASIKQQMEALRQELLDLETEAVKTQ